MLVMSGPRVVIAGGGVMGWATAAFLRRLGHAGPVAVLERGGEEYSSTARSAGGITRVYERRVTLVRDRPRIDP